MSSRRAHGSCSTRSLSQAFPGVHLLRSPLCEWHHPLLVLATLQLRLTGASRRIPGDLLPSGSQTRRQPAQGARFILQDSVFLLFLSSWEAPRH